MRHRVHGQPQTQLFKRHNWEKSQGAPPSLFLGPSSEPRSPSSRLTKPHEPLQATSSFQGKTAWVTHSAGSFRWPAGSARALREGALLSATHIQRLWHGAVEAKLRNGKKIAAFNSYLPGRGEVIKANFGAVNQKLVNLSCFLVVFPQANLRISEFLRWGKEVGVGLWDPPLSTLGFFPANICTS